MQQSIRPQTILKNSKTFTKFIRPLTDILAELPVLASGSNRPLEFDFEASQESGLLSPQPFRFRTASSSGARRGRLRPPGDCAARRRVKERVFRRHQFPRAGTPARGLFTARGKSIRSAAPISSRMGRLGGGGRVSDQLLPVHGVGELPGGVQQSQSPPRIRPPARHTRRFCPDRWQSR